MIRISISANCYKKIQDETKLMQEQIVSELGLSPADKDVVVLYDGEKGNQVNNQIISHIFNFWINQFLL